MPPHLHSVCHPTARGKGSYCRDCSLSRPAQETLHLPQRQGWSTLGRGILYLSKKRTAHSLEPQDVSGSGFSCWNLQEHRSESCGSSSSSHSKLFWVVGAFMGLFKNNRWIFGSGKAKLSRAASDLSGGSQCLSSTLLAFVTPRTVSA